MKNAKELWKFLNGKKTAIGMLLMLLAQGSQAFFPHLMNAEQLNFLQTTGTVIGGMGIIHKGAKTQTAQDIIAKIKPKGN